MAESEIPRPEQATQVTLTFRHKLTDAEVEQLKFKTEALEARQITLSASVVRVGESVSIPAGEDAIARAECPLGYYAVGGGGDSSDGDNRVFLTSSVPEPQAGYPYIWKVGYRNTSDREHSIRAHVVCVYANTI